MSRLAASIVLLWGWQRLLLALVAGALTALAVPPFDAWPVAFVTVPVLVWLIDGSTPPEGAGIIRRMLPAAAVGWWFGFGYFVAGLWWIGVSFLVDGDRFAWLIPVAVLVLPAGLALLWALGAGLARLFWSEGWPRVLVFAVVMAGVEWLRGHILTGFPWNAFGYALMPNDVMMQVASLGGVWGVTLIAFAVFAAPALLAGGSARDVHWVAFAAFLAIGVADAAYGFYRLGSASDATVAGVRLRIVQPSIPQRNKDDPSLWDANFTRHLELSAGPGFDEITHLIWPETAVPYILTEAPFALAAIASLLPAGDTLITGAPRADAGAPGEGRAVMNSVLVINDRGEIVDSYDKVHLVPFGEYLPFRETLEPLGIRQLISLPGGFSAGLERRTLLAAGLPPFSPLICYEAIFAGEVTEVDLRPGWLLNVTNDAWYGDTPGPRQHFQQAVVRAVEEGLPLIRAANNGISAIVDPYGRVRQRLGVNDVGVIDGELPQSLPPTVYSRYGDLIPAGLGVLMLLLAMLGRIASPRRSN